MAWDTYRKSQPKCFHLLAHGGEDMRGSRVLGAQEDLLNKAASERDPKQIRGKPGGDVKET